MNARFVRSLTVLLAVAGGSSLSVAQAPLSGGFGPVSKPGGYASQELASIYQESVGGGHSSASFRSAVLNSVYSQIPAANRPTSSGPRIGLGAGAAAPNKPFSSFTPAPTVSPYLNLFREDFEGGGDLNYNTLVRPQLQQQQANQQFQRQGIELARRLQAMSAQGDFNPRGSESQFPTGHQTVFRYYGHYYPTMGRARR